MEQQSKQPSDIIFALDIGTRSVIGVLGIAEGDQVRILDTEIIEHPKRAMIDGQIEDIEQVARIAGAVKANLEARCEFVLNRVCVAAAGRALRTHQVSKVFSLPPKTVLDESKISELEGSTLELANLELFQQGSQMSQSQFHCVGYSVMRYYLDGYPISTLIGHHGSEVKIDMLVTYLPNEVIESLYATMKKIDLDIESMTLEPIAAMNLVIPQELRNLNLALVDIGAGTSDIAISRDGSVVAYGMATIAGDELTEAICSHYLVDFNTAEQIKHGLAENRPIAFHDILGNAYELSTEELFPVVQEALDLLCTTIAEKMKEANGKAPAAVFLVGGASKIPTIGDLVSEKLGLNRSKVAIGGSMVVRKSILSEKDLLTPEYVTPLGIVLTAMQSKGRDGKAVTVNGVKSTMLIQSVTSVIDLLLASGYQYQQMIASSGKNLLCTVNGQQKCIRGSYATPAVVTVNSVGVSVFTQVKGGDSIEFIPSKPGADAQATVQDIVPWNQFEVSVDGISYKAGTLVKMGTSYAAAHASIYEGAILETSAITALQQLLDHYQLSLPTTGYTLRGMRIGLDYQLQPNDVIATYQPAAEKEHTIQQELMVVINGRPVQLPSKEDNSPYVFLDMLNYVNIDLKQVQGDVNLLLNGKEASFLEPINHLDEIEITWK